MVKARYNQQGMTRIGLAPEALTLDPRELFGLSKQLKATGHSPLQNLGVQIGDHLTGRNVGLERLLYSSVAQPSSTDPVKRVIMGGQKGARQQAASARSRIASAAGAPTEGAAFSPDIAPGRVQQGPTSFPLARTESYNPAGTTAMVPVSPGAVAGTPKLSAVTPASKSTTTSPTNKAAAGSEVGSKQAADITGYAGSMMGGLAAVGVGAGVGGVTSYATGGEFGKGAVAGGMVAGGAYLGMSTMATNSKAINAAVAKGGEGFGAGVMGAMQGANQVIGSASVAGRRAALMGGAGLAGLTFGGNRRSHRRGFNQSRGSRI